MEKTKGNMSNFWLCVTKGTIVSLCIVMVAILLFAFVVKWAGLDSGVINAVNQIIKIVAIFFGVYACMKKSTEKYLYKGIAVGALYQVLAFLLFSILNGSFSIGVSIVWDILLAGVIGLISSIIAKLLMK